MLQDKIDVNGKNTHPVYKILKEGQPQDLPNDFMVPGEKGKITWNYTSALLPCFSRLASFPRACQIENFIRPISIATL